MTIFISIIVKYDSLLYYSLLLSIIVYYCNEITIHVGTNLFVHNEKYWY